METGRGQNVGDHDDARERVTRSRRTGRSECDVIISLCMCTQTSSVTSVDRERNRRPLQEG